MGRAMEDQALVRMEEISKNFGHIKALDRVSQPQMEYPYFVFDPELDKYVRV